MIIKTRVFELAQDKYHNLSDLAKAMGLSISQVYRVRMGKRGINVICIAQGSSEYNISFVVEEIGMETTVRDIHREFGLDRSPERVEGRTAC